MTGQACGTTPVALYPFTPCDDATAIARSMETTLHDLCQPLTSVALALELLRREPDPAVVDAMLAAAGVECARAMRDVEHLRTELTRWSNRTGTTQRGKA